MDKEKARGVTHCTTCRGEGVVMVRPANYGSISCDEPVSVVPCDCGGGDDDAA